MRNVIIAGAAVAVGAGIFVMSQQESGESPSVSAPTPPKEVSPLAYIPADTVLFSGQMEPFPLKNYLKSTTFAQVNPPAEVLQELNDESDPKKRFFASLVKSYFEAAKSAETFQKTFGLPDEIRAYVYAVGFLPVIRYEVTDEASLWAVLDKAETESGFKHEARTLGDLSYRSYPLENNAKGEKVELLVAFEDGWATWSVNTHVNDPSAVELVLAQKMPENSLKDAGTIDEIAAKHGFVKSAISYIDHQGLVKAFTTDKGNALAEMITKAMSAGGDPNALAEVRTPECQAEMGAIAANWPRTVVGAYSQDDMNITPERSTMKMAMVVESNNTVVLDALKSIQGFVPAYLQKAQVFGMGLGIDVNKMSPALSSLWGNMLEPAYTCAPLVEMQAGVREANPAALGMFTGMAQGVKGVGIGVQDFSLNMDAPQPTLDSLQAVISLSADNPEVLFNMAKSFAPPLAGVQLPADGSPVDLSGVVPVPPEVKVKPMLALKGKHLVIYTGEGGKAVADSLAGEVPASNGLLNMSIDYKKMLAPMVPIMEMTADPEVTEQLEVLKNMDMRVKIDIGVKDKGIEFLSEADIKAPAQ